MAGRQEGLKERLLESHKDRKTEIMPSVRHSIMTDRKKDDMMSGHHERKTESKMAFMLS